MVSLEHIIKNRLMTFPVGQNNCLIQLRSLACSFWAGKMMETLITGHLPQLLNCTITKYTLKTTQLCVSTTFCSPILNVAIVCLSFCNVPCVPASPVLYVDVAFVFCAYLMWFRSFADSLLMSNLSSGENDKERERDRDWEERKGNTL